MGGLVSKTTTNAHRELEMRFLDQALDQALDRPDLAEQHADKVDQAQAFVKDKLQEN